MVIPGWKAVLLLFAVVVLILVSQSPTTINI